MFKNFKIFLLVFVTLSCSVSSQKGQAVGFVTHLRNEGLFWKSWEFEVNSSQTGMTSTAKEVDLSVDNDNFDQELVNVLDSAQKYGWKVQVDYQQNFGVNCMGNRGQTSKFIKKVEILDRTPLGGLNPNGNLPLQKSKDTLYMIIIPNK